VETIHVIGDVDGKTALLVDDIVDSAGTLVKAVDALVDAGAQRVLACCTHPVLSGPAIERLEASPVEKLIVSNTIPLHDHAMKCGKIHVLSVASLLGDAILSVHDETSVSKLFV
jgi:ribose-phosphate pyrophosphokinase